MNTSIPLPIVLMSVLAVALIYAASRAVAAVLASARRTAEAIEANTVALNEIQEALAGLKGDIGEASKLLQSVPKLLEAVTRIGDAQLQIMQSQAQQQSSNPFPRGNTPLPSRDVEAANLEHDISQMMRAEGITREEALMRMNGANDSSVWDTMGQGWR
jgi:hypothetical protein